VRAAVINARFAKPLDEKLILEWARKTLRVVTIEEAAIPGGFGDAVLELASRNAIQGLRARAIGVPDRFIDHGTRDSLLKSAGLHPEPLAAEIARWLNDEPRPTSEPLAPVVSNA
jgi:1-deoxy-D-xylulose-5-phosphate synthase